MRQRKLLIAFGMILVMFGLVYLLGREQAPKTTSQAHGLLFPELKANLGGLTRISIRGASDTVTLERKESKWGVEQRAGYPADFSRLESMLRSLAEAKLVEAKTSRPEQHHRLGLSGPDASDGASVEVKLYGGEDDARFALLIGNQASGRGGSYILRAGETQAWLVDQSLEAPSAPDDWIDETVLNLDFAAIATYSRSGADGGDFKASKATPSSVNFVLDNPPGDRGLRYESVLNGPARSITSLSAEDVRVFESVPEQVANGVSTEFLTFDGLLVQVRAWEEEDEGAWITLRAENKQPPATEADGSKSKSTKEASLTEAETSDESSSESSDKASKLSAEQQAREINRRVSGWAYKVSQYTYGELSKGLDDYLEEPKDDADSSASDASGSSTS